MTIGNAPLNRSDEQTHDVLAGQLTTLLQQVREPRVLVVYSIQRRHHLLVAAHVRRVAAKVLGVLGQHKRNRTLRVVPVVADLLHFPKT